MGGIGSGNFGWRRVRRNSVEHALALDMAALKGAHRLIPETTMVGQWEVATPVGYRTITIAYDGDLTDIEEACLHLSFYVRGTKCYQTLRLAVNNLRLGCVRLWFVCPVTGQRARVLYLPEGKDRFASRKGHGLGYRSQGESELLRKITRAQKIRAHLIGDLSIHTPFPPRPRGMHRRTYERLRTEALKIEAAALEALRAEETLLHQRVPLLDRDLGAAPFLDHPRSQQC